MRGPVVYCLELPKQQNGQSVWNDGIFLPKNIRFKSHYYKNRLGGITVLTGRALNAAGKQLFDRKTRASISSRNADWTNQLYRRFESHPFNGSETGTIDIELIPYFAWTNRGVSWLEVWIPLVR